jgi:quercetin dioxygenase-like cupin family protein
MKLLTATAISLSVLASAPAHANEASASTGSGARPAVSHADSQTITITRSSSQPSSKGSAQYFTGSVRIDPLFQAKDPSYTSGAYVTFEPGGRSAWHTHPLGQTLIVTAGLGWVQQEGREKREIKLGDVIWIPPGVKHWHGATATNAVTHIAIQEEVGGKNVEWLEHVSDQQYGR